jgi:2-polyprenyl-6-methoxyphenol hydroxylase-like FAD-dependent oxidoreductase
VLIVGGSLVGLSAALFLAQQGVPSLTVERHPGTAIHPRAGHLHLRTLELMRSVDLEKPLRRLSADKFFPNGGINAMHTLAGGEVASYIPNLNAGVEELSPSRRLFVAQDALEPLLRRRAEELGATLRYSTEVIDLVEDSDGVTAVVRDLATGRLEEVRANYVVAADGNRSPRRHRLAPPRRDRRRPAGRRWLARIPRAAAPRRRRSGWLRVSCPPIPPLPDIPRPVLAQPLQTRSTKG